MQTDKPRLAKASKVMQISSDTYHLTLLEDGKWSMKDQIAGFFNLEYQPRITGVFKKTYLTLNNTGTFLVQKSSFDDGSKIFVNFGMNPYKSEEVSLGSYNFEARLGNGEMLKGSVVSDLRVV